MAKPKPEIDLLLPYDLPAEAFVPDPHRRHNHVYLDRTDETFHVSGEQYQAVFAASPIRDTTAEMLSAGSTGSTLAPIPPDPLLEPDEMKGKTMEELVHIAKENGAEVPPEATLEEARAIAIASIDSALRAKTEGQ